MSVRLEALPTLLLRPRRLSEQRPATIGICASSHSPLPPFTEGYPKEGSKSSSSRSLSLDPLHIGPSARAW